MTQSAVSQHVATLERAMDLPLIERGTRPVQLTDAGFALVRHARALIARIGNAEQELGEITGRRNGRLRFGSFPTALATFVPAALARFQRQHADVSLTVIDDHLQRLLPRLDDGELDLAIIYDHPALPEVSSRHHNRVHLLDDAFQAVLPRGHRLARAATTSPSLTWPTRPGSAAARPAPGSASSGTPAGPPGSTRAWP